jgi:hypothetical protein
LPEPFPLVPQPDWYTARHTEHLTDPELDELLESCLQFLWERCTGPSQQVKGWYSTTGTPGLRGWLGRQAQIHGAEAERLRPLRTEVYDLLEERGLIIKGPGHNVPIHVAPPKLPGTVPPASEVITITPAGAGYGDSVTNAVVEQAAMNRVLVEYRDQGWSVADVSAQNLGWDITVQRRGDERHLEVKGVTGGKPSVLLTRNEHAKALTDPSWHLVVVTQALTRPTLVTYAATNVVAHCEPYVYRARLSQDAL